MEEQFVVFRHCMWLHEAHLIVSVLESADIAATIPDAFTIGVRPELGNALGGVRVLVRASDFDHANEVLRSVEAAPGDEKIS